MGVNLGLPCQALVRAGAIILSCLLFTVTAWPQTPQTLPQGAAVRGVLKIRGLFNESKDLEVAALPSRTDIKMSTGDVFTSDGKVLALRLGMHVGQLLGGSLWHFPLVAGTSGKADVQFDGVGLTGSVSWKVDAADGGLVISADVNIPYEYTTLTDVHRGTWVGRFADSSWIAKSSRLRVTGLQTKREDTATTFEQDP